MRILLIAFFLVTSNAYALEVTDFRVSRTSNFLVTVALDDLDGTVGVTCIIYYNDKPIAKQSSRIDGVGTIVISNPANITGEGLSAKCIKSSQ